MEGQGLAVGGVLGAKLFLRVADLVERFLVAWETKRSGEGVGGVGAPIFIERDGRIHLL